MVMERLGYYRHVPMTCQVNLTVDENSQVAYFGFYMHALMQWGQHGDRQTKVS